MTAPRARDDVAAATLDGEAVIHCAGQVHLLDPVATLVWRCCDGVASVEEIADELAEVFATPVATVRRDVAGVIDQLAALGLLTDTDTDTDTPDAHVPRNELDVELQLLEHPPGSCASCAEKVWPHRSTFRIGAHLVGVGSDRDRTDAALREVLTGHTVHDPVTAGDAPPFFAISAPPSPPPPAGPQPLYLLHRADTVVSRSRRPGPVVRALCGQLATYGDLGDLGLATVGGLVVARGDRAMIVAEPADPIRYRHALARHGVLAADQPVAIVDPAARDVVVGAPGLDVDPAALDALDADDAAGPGPGPEPLPWGRYRIAALGVAGVPDAATAILTFGPVRGDHRDHAATFAALRTLLEAVPVLEAVEPDAVGAFLASA